MYYENEGDTRTEKETGNAFANVDDDLGEICAYLMNLIQSDSHENKKLLNEIELFFRALVERNTSYSSVICTH